MSSTPQAERLTALLHQHRVGHPSATGAAAWSAFKAFGREVFGPEGVGLLFQVGTFDFTGTPLFYFDPVCQFEVIDSDGEHDHFAAALRVDLRSRRIAQWRPSFDFPTADAFFAAVEALPAFQAAVRRVDYRLSVSHEVV